MYKKIIIHFLIILVPFNCFALEVTVIARPALKEENNKKHLVILSEAIPKGAWEVGPDNFGNITTTNKEENLQEWNSSIQTYKYIHSNLKNIETIKVNVNKKSLLKAIDLFETSFKSMKYKKGDDNYAVIQTIYGAGGPKIDL